MCRSMAHGGPDDEGLFVEGCVGFGHRRLSIIDLSSAGHQPMVSMDGETVITFNGEIYNYLVLRTELIGKGFIFRSNSDTEVIIAAYTAWGIACFDRLEGIFALSIFDKAKKKVFLVRDHLGIKPLYYSSAFNQLIFASEVKAFRAFDPSWKEDEDWRIHFLAFGSIPFPLTTLQDVLQVEAGCYLEYDLRTKLSTTKSFSAPPKESTINNLNEAVNISRRAVTQALEKNLIADAPLGIFLSGGIDSSLLTLLADHVQQKVKTVSVNFEEALFDERSFQQLVLAKSQHVDHHSYMVTENIFWENLPDIWNAMDQPSADGVNSYFVSKYAAKYGLKAVLSGLGADEVFGGYISFARIQWLKRLRALPLKSMIARVAGMFSEPLKRLAFLTIPGAVGDYLFLRGIHTPEAIARLLDVTEEHVWKVLKLVKVQVPEKLGNVEYASFLETRMYMGNQLLKDMDYMSMWHGLEARLPFLDIALLREIDSISPALRIQDTLPKYLITEPFRNLLPDEVIFRKKNGFTFPFPVWMKNSLHRFTALMPKGKEVERIVHKFEAGNVHWSKCWSLAVLNNYNTRQQKVVNEPTADYYRTGESRKELLEGPLDI